MDKKSKNTKVASKSADKKPKAKTEVKVDKKQQDFQRLEEYLNESGLYLAFNIIFAELISKQILRENYFTYTSMRLTQIGKEIEGLKTKEVIYIDDKEEPKEGENIQEKAEQTDIPPPEAEEKKEEIFLTNPPQKEKDKKKGKENEKGNDKGKEKGNDKGKEKGNDKGKEKGNDKRKGKENEKGNDKGKGKENEKGNDKGKENEKDKGKAKESEKKSEVKSNNTKKKKNN